MAAGFGRLAVLVLLVPSLGFFRADGADEMPFMKQSISFELVNGYLQHVVRGTPCHDGRMFSVVSHGYGNFVVECRAPAGFYFLDIDHTQPPGDGFFYAQNSCLPAECGTAFDGMQGIGSYTWTNETYPAVLTLFGYWFAVGGIKQPMKP